MSLAERHQGSVSASSIEYAAVTERVALEVGCLDGVGVPQRTYALATEAFEKELNRPPVRGRVVILREERLEILDEVRYLRGGARTHAVVMSSEPRMVRFVDTIHTLEPDAGT